MYLQRPTVVTARAHPLGLPDHRQPVLREQHPRCCRRPRLRLRLRHGHGCPAGVSRPLRRDHVTPHLEPARSSSVSDPSWRRTAPVATYPTLWSCTYRCAPCTPPLGSRSPRKPNHCLSLTPDQYNIWTPRLCGLMVRRWPLIGYFPILYYPQPSARTRGVSVR